MRLVDLEPKWLVARRGGRKIGIRFLCPCATCLGSGCMLAVLFKNPIGGGNPAPNDPNRYANYEGRRWSRTGETFETLSITPSIDASANGHWHGFVTNGEAA